MKKFSLKFIAAMMAVFMLFSICAPAAIAANNNAANTDADKKEINYVSFGDSMTNGYGLDGYNGNSGVFDYGYTSYANQLAAYLAGVDFEEWMAGGSQGSGLLFDGPDATVIHHQLAMSGCRAEDLHWLLEFDFSDEAMELVNVGSATAGHGYGWKEFVAQYEEKWYDIFTSGDMRTFTDLCNCDDRCTTAATYILAHGYDSPYATQAQKDAAQAVLNGGDPEYATWGNHVPIVAEYYQNAVKKADVISLALGNTNFGTFIFNEIYNSVNGDSKPMYFRVERAIENLSPKMQTAVLTLRDELYALASDYLGVELSYELPEEGEKVEVLDALANTLVYGILSYYINYAGTVEDILSLSENPDLEIIIVGLMNAYANDSDVTVEGATIGDLLGLLYPVVNGYLAALPALMQETGNELYNKATFYYADNASVACMVEVYGNDFYFTESGEPVIYDEKDNYEQGSLVCNRNSLIRQRFFRDVMGTVRQMHGGSFSGLALDYSITIEELYAYDEMTLVEQAAYAAENSAKALTLAVYLAYEDAHIVAGKKSPVTIEAVMGLGNIQAPKEVEATLKALLAQNAPSFAPVAATAIANRLNKLVGESKTGFRAATTYADILAVYVGAKSANDVALEIVKSDLNAAIIEMLARDGFYKEVAYPQFAANYGLPYTWEQFKQVGGAYYDMFINGAEDAWNQYKDAALGRAYAQAAATLAPYVQKAVDGVASLCTLLALTDAFAFALVDDPTSNSLLCLNARTQIGTGLGGHPSAGGHADLFDVVKTSYETGHTANKETLENALFLLAEAQKLIEEYYDEALLYAYNYAQQNGYIDAANDAIDSMIAELEETLALLKEVFAAQSLEAKAALEAKVNAIIETLLKIKEAAESGVETFISVIGTLKAELAANYADLYALLIEWHTELMNATVEAYEAIVAQLKGAIEALSAEAKAAFEAVIAEVEALIAELEVAAEAGVEVFFAYVEGVKAELEAKLETLRYLLNEWKAELIEQGLAYYNALLAQIEYQIFVLENVIIPAILAQIEYQIHVLENEMIPAIIEAVELQIQKACEYFAQKVMEAYGFALEVKATIEEMIVDLQLMIIAKIAAVYGFVLDLNAKVEAKIEQLKLFVAFAIAEIYNLVSDANAKAEAYIENVRLQAIIKLNKIYGIAVDVNATLEQIVAAIANHIDKITSGDYTVSDDSFYVAIDGEAYADLLAEALHLTEEQFAVMSIDEIDYAQLAMADLITVAYTDSTVVSFVLMQLFGALSGMEPVELDWAALIGEENVVFVDELRANILEAFEIAGIPENVTVPVADFGNITISAKDVALTLIESALYEKIRYNQAYAATMMTIKGINPDATVVALGAYDLYDVVVPDYLYEEIIPVTDILKLDTLPAILLSLAAAQIPADSVLAEELTAVCEYFASLDYTVDDVTVSGAISLENINMLTSAHPFFYATLFENVFFVNVMGVCTNLEAIIATYEEDGDIEALISALTSVDIAAPYEDSCEYIVSQILAALDVECDHIYDDACTDVDCNRCGEIRVPVHTFTDNYVYNEDATHMADGTKTIVCDICGEKGEETVTAEGTKLVDAHNFNGAWLSDDTNHWQVCECGETANVAPHVDADKNELCDVCSHAVAATPDDPTPPAGGGDNGNQGGNNNNNNTTDSEKDGMSTGAKVAIIVSSSVVGVVGTFSLGWFGIAKKSWADFVRIFKK